MGLGFTRHAPHALRPGAWVGRGEQAFCGAWFVAGVLTCSRARVKGRVRVRVRVRAALRWL